MNKIIEGEVLSIFQVGIRVRTNQGRRPGTNKNVPKMSHLEMVHFLRMVAKVAKQE